MNIFEAIDNSDVNKIKELLDSGIDINIKYEKKSTLFYLFTPLHLACFYSNIDIIKLLLSYPDINVNIQDNNGNTPLHLPCSDELVNINVVELLLAHPDIDVNIQDKYENTPLYKACYNNNINIIRLLLAHPNINVNIKNKNEETPLYRACKDNSIEITKLLLQHPNIDVNSKECLRHVCEYDQLEIVKLLLSHPNIDVNGKYKSNPLSVILFNDTLNSILILKLLVSHPKIDINKENLFDALVLNVSFQEPSNMYYDLYINKIKIMMSHPNLECNVYFESKEHVKLTYLLKKRFPRTNKIKINQILDTIE